MSGAVSFVCPAFADRGPFSGAVCVKGGAGAEGMAGGGGGGTPSPPCSVKNHPGPRPTHHTILQGPQSKGQGVANAPNTSTGLHTGGAGGGTLTPPLCSPPPPPPRSDGPPPGGGGGGGLHKGGVRVPPGGGGAYTTPELPILVLKRP